MYEAGKNTSVNVPQDTQFAAAQVSFQDGNYLAGAKICANEIIAKVRS